MFLQKLKLDKDETYESLAELENILENLQLTFNHIPIITFYSSKSFSDMDIENSLNENKNSIILTIEQYKKYKDRFDCSHIILQDFSLLESFGHSISDFDKPLIVIEKSFFKKLPLSRFFINSEKDEKYVVAYILSQIFKSVIVTKYVNKIQMLCKIFKIDADVYSYKEIDNIRAECVICLEGYCSVDAERVFVVGNRNNSNLEDLKIDISVAGKFKYRILDIIKKLGPRTVRNRDKFDYSKYDYISR